MVCFFFSSRRWHTRYIGDWSSDVCSSVLAPDQRGYNLSDKPRGVGGYRIDLLAGDVRRLIEACGEERAAVVGHDWGAEIGRASCRARAELLVGAGLNIVEIVVWSVTPIY